MLRAVDSIFAKIDNGATCRNNDDGWHLRANLTIGRPESTFLELATVAIKELSSATFELQPQVSKLWGS